MWKNVWCHLALNIVASNLMLTRHGCLGDDGIGSGAKASKPLQERFQSVKTPTLLTLIAQIARLQLEHSEDLDSFFIRGQELLTREQKAGKQSQRHSSMPWSSMVCHWFLKFLLNMKASNRQRISQRWRKGCRASMKAQHRDTSDKMIQGHC